MQAHQGPNDSVKVECSGTVEVPLLDGGRLGPMVGVKIGGKTYRFVLDTGAQGGRIPPGVVASLGLQPIGVVRSSDPSGKNARDVNIYQVPEMRIGGATVRDATLFADAAGGPKGGPMEFDGVLAAGCFHDLLLTIDYPKRRLILSPRKMTADEARRSIPYKLRHGIPTVAVQIGDFKIDCDLDTGSEGALSIPSSDQAKIRLDGEPRKIGQARTLFNSFDIYEAKLKDPVAVGGMPLSVDRAELQGVLPHGNLGSRVLMKFRVTLDQRTHRILLES